MEPARITTHDNFDPAGRLQDGVLSLALYAGLGAWYPEGDSSRPWTIAAFGEEGKALTVPSPLIRVPEGTTVHASVRNTLTQPLRVHGLCERPGTCEPITVLPGETRELQFALKIAGTFSYTASTTSQEAPVYRLRDDRAFPSRRSPSSTGAPGRARNDSAMPLATRCIGAC